MAKAKKLVKVTLAEMSGAPKTIEVVSGTTVRKALLNAGYDNPADLKANLRVNSKEVGLLYKLKKGDFITIAPNVQGGAR